MRSNGNSQLGFFLARSSTPYFSSVALGIAIGITSKGLELLGGVWSGPHSQLKYNDQQILG